MGERDAPAALRSAWDRLGRGRLGRRVFALIIRRLIPYTGALGAEYEELRPGYARIALRERRGVRNHLGSIHAVALANLGEVTTGFALMYGAPPSVRGILTGLQIEYVKKARGRITAQASAEHLDVTSAMEQRVTGELTDAAGAVVARVTATWRLAPRAGGPPR